MANPIKSVEIPGHVAQNIIALISKTPITGGPEADAAVEAKSYMYQILEVLEARKAADEGSHGTTG